MGIFSNLTNNDADKKESTTSITTENQSDSEWDPFAGTGGYNPSQHASKIQEIEKKQREEQERKLAEQKRIKEMTARIPAVTIDNLGNKEYEVIGSVFGNVVVSKNVIKDFGAAFKDIFGGELKTYTKMSMAGQEIATERMKLNALEQNADAIIGLKFSVTSTNGGTNFGSDPILTILAYGTAIKIK